jgi:hypothetical protein
MDSEPAGVQFYFRALPSPVAVQCRWTFPTSLVSGNLRTELLNDPDIRTILQVVENVERPERKEIADRSPNYISY